MSAETQTLLEILKLSTNYLSARGIQSARRAAEELLSDALGMPRLDLYLNHDRPLTPVELQCCRERLQRRGMGEPGAYIHGSVEFFGCQLHVTSAVLIPRPETELLVDRIVKELKQEPVEDKTLWDLCTGSGCLAIAIKRQLPDLHVVASDLSEQAIEIAKKNARLNEVEIEFRQGDLLAPFQGQQADFVVSNPPYVTEAEYQQLDREVKEFEPRLALVGGKRGTEYYELLAEQLPFYLKSSAKVWFEIGTGQGDALKQLFAKTPWKRQRLDRDWSGHDRFFSLEIE